MTATDAIAMLGERFPVLKERVDEDDLSGSPHIAYSLLAAEMLDNRSDEALLGAVSRFVDELADSRDSLLEELLVVDVLEGIAQDPDLTKRLKTMIGPKATEFLERVETEFFGRCVR